MPDFGEQLLFGVVVEEEIQPTGILLGEVAAWTEGDGKACSPACC